MDREINLSWNGIWKCIVAILIVGGLWYFRHIILLFLTAWILAASLENFVKFFTKRKIPRLVAVLLVYFMVGTAIGGILYIITPPLVQNIATLMENLPGIIKSKEASTFFKNYLPFINNKNLLSTLFSTDNTVNYISNLAKNAKNIVGIVADFLIMMVIAFYLSIDKNWTRNMIEMFMPRQFKNYFISLWERTQKKMVYWLYSQLVLSLFLTSTSIIVFYILKVQYPLFSAVIFGLLDFIPFIGPALATVIILFINSSDGFTKTLIILLVCLILQYFENIIGPYIRNKFMKVDPIITLLFISLGGMIGGPLGIFVAIPLSTVVIDFLKDLKNQKINESRCQRLIS